MLAVALLAWPRPLIGLVSAGFIASTILALVISLTVGLFGFNESISANYVVEALVLESRGPGHPAGLDRDRRSGAAPATLRPASNRPGSWIFEGHLLVLLLRIL